MNLSQLYFSGGTDLQRLLNNIKPNTPRPRGCGRTYTTLLLMAGQVLYGPKDALYLYLGESSINCTTVECEFREIIKRKGFQSSLSVNNQCKIDATNQRFVFTTLDNWERAMRGYKIETVYIDVLFTPTVNDAYIVLLNQSNHIHLG